MGATRITKFLLIVGIGLLSAPLSAFAFPTNPVRIIVPFSPGGAGDVAARVLATELQVMWKQSVLVENRVGAGGLIGYEAVAKSAPDGHTLLQAHSAYPIYHLVTKKENLRFDPMKDLRVAAMFGETLNLVVTNASVPAADFKSFVAYAKANAGRVNYSSLGRTSFLALASEAFMYMTGTRFSEIAYKGSPEGIAGLVRNDTQLMYNPYQTLKPFIDQGTVRPLFVISRTRAAELPGVPTNAEVGLEAYTPRAWQGIGVPSGTPAEVVNRINADVATVVARTDIQATFRKLNLIPLTMTVNEIQEFIGADLARWSAVVKSANIEPQ